MWAVMAWRAGMGYLAGIVGNRIAALVDNPVCSVLFCIFFSLGLDILFTGGKNCLLSVMRANVFARHVPEPEQDMVEVQMPEN